MDLAEAPNSTKRILVVEDDDLLRDLVCRSLARDGFETVQARNGAEAFDIFTRTFHQDDPEVRLDAAVTDYLMPRTDGADLIRKIKAVSPEFPVVLVTGEAPDSVILQLAGLPKVMAMLKPFRPDALRQGLRCVLQEPVLEGRPELRKSIRVEGSAACSFFDVKNDNESSYFATVRNLSFGGCYLQSEKILPAGSKIRFFFHGLDQYVMVGSVAWASKVGMGISLMPESSETCAFFKKFVLNKLKQKGVGIMGAHSAFEEAGLV